MKKIEYYKSNDGKIFYDVQECLNYEKEEEERIIKWNENFNDQTKIPGLYYDKLIVDLARARDWKMEPNFIVTCFPYPAYPINAMRKVCSDFLKETDKWKSYY